MNKTFVCSKKSICLNMGFQMSSDIRKCCALWASSFANSLASCRACFSGKCKAAFLVATASCFSRAHKWLLLRKRLWLDSPRWASLYMVSTSLWPTMITSLLCEINFSGGWPSSRLSTNPPMAFWRAPKYRRQCSDREDDWLTSVPVPDSEEWCVLWAYVMEGWNKEDDMWWLASWLLATYCTINFFQPYVL